MPQSPGRIELRWPAPDAAQIVLVGEHDLASGEEFEETVQSVLGSVRQLIVDLTEIEFIDTTLINGLCRAKRQADLRALAFNAVVGRNDIVGRALEVTGLVDTLHAVTTLDEALQPRQSLQHTGGGHSRHRP